MFRLIPLVVGACATGLVACAAGPQEMHYFPSGDESAAATVWPGPPEMARLQYAGELIGESNFRSANGNQAGSAVRLWKWIAGIGRSRDRVTELVRPQSGVVDSRLRILVTDAGRRAVLVFDEAAGLLSEWTEAAPGQAFRAPVGIAVDANDDVLIADAQLGYVARLSSDGEPAGVIGTDVLERPTGLARDSYSGRLFVADSTAHDVKVFDANGMLLQIVGTRGTGPGEFNGPTHLSYADGALYVTDTLNARVQVFDADGTFRGSIGERGLFVGNLVRPKGVTTDRDGNVYVIESYHDHLLIFDEHGNLLLPIGGTGSDAGRFFLPSGAWSDGGNRLFFADMFNGRVVIFNYIGDTA